MAVNQGTAQQEMCSERSGENPPTTTSESGGQKAEPESPQALQNKMFRKYLALRKNKLLHKEKAEAASKEMEGLEQEILMLLAEMGGARKASFKIDGCTLFAKRTFYPKAAQGVDKAVLAKALRRAGKAWSFIVGWSYNASKLRSRVIELRDDPKKVDKDGLPILPPSLRALVDLGEKVELGVSSPTK